MANQSAGVPWPTPAGTRDDGSLPAPLCEEFLAISVAPGSDGPVGPGVNPLGAGAHSMSFATGVAWLRWRAATRPMFGASHPPSPMREPLVVALSAGIRHEDGAPLSRHDLMVSVRDGVGLDQIAAPFAAAVIDDVVWVAADHLGLRHVYMVTAPGWAAVSTSATLLARMARASIDPYSLSLYRYTNHHFGERTAYVGVTKLPPAHRWRLARGEVTCERFVLSADPVAGVHWSPAAGADLLRHLVELYADHYPQPIIELSGGMDSRIVLAGIRPSRRHEIRTLTLTAPDSEDAIVAAEVADALGLAHQEVDLGELASVDPADAHERVMRAALHHDGGSNPVVLAAYSWVQERVEPSVQLTGQAGEMFRGIYILEPRNDIVRPEYVRRLLRRRGYIRNQMVIAAALEPEFEKSSYSAMMEQVMAVFEPHAANWRLARDFFLFERVHRWGGVTYTGGCYDRIVGSPFFDRRFLSMSAALPTSVKQGSGYAARCLELLDMKLAEIPLETGLRATQLPRILAEMSTTVAAKKLARNVVERFRNSGRPPVGSAALANRTLAHWRAHPELLSAVASTGFINEAWLDEILSGRQDAGPNEIGLLANLQVMTVELSKAQPATAGDMTAPQG